MRRLTALALALAVVVPAAAEVYRWVDADGNVVYSDTPQPGAERIEIREPTIIPAPRAGDPGPRPAPDAKPVPYTSVTIAAPADEATVRDNTGRVDVSVSLAPALQTEFGHQLGLFFDGQPVGAPGTSTAFVLEDVARGAHTLEARVTDAEGSPVAKSNVSTFFLHKHSVLHKAR